MGYLRQKRGGDGVVLVLTAKDKALHDERWYVNNQRAPFLMPKSARWYTDDRRVKSQIEYSYRRPDRHHELTVIMQEIDRLTALIELWREKLHNTIKYQNDGVVRKPMSHSVDRDFERGMIDDIRHEIKYWQCVVRGWNK